MFLNTSLKSVRQSTCPPTTHYDAAVDLLVTATSQPLTMIEHPSQSSCRRFDTPNSVHRPHLPRSRADICTGVKIDLVGENLLIWMLPVLQLRATVDSVPDLRSLLQRRKIPIPRRPTPKALFMSL